MQQLERGLEDDASFVLEDYFAGPIRAWGMFVDRFGRIQRQFSVDLRGDREDRELVLTEDFVFDDGERSRRIWRITPLGDGRYEGRADDVVGTAKGQITGNRLTWSYDLELPIGGRVWRVHFDDVMLRQDDAVLLNRATMSKFGIRLGEVIICFQKSIVPDEPTRVTKASVQRDEPALTS